FSGKTRRRRNNVFVWRCRGCAERFRRAGADRNQQQIVFTLFPVQLVGRLGGHPVKQESWVIVWGYATIDEYECLGRVGRVPLKNLGREINGCRGAGTNQLPKRNPQVAIASCGVVVLGVGIAAD